MDLLSQRVDSEKRLFVLRKLPVCRELVMMYFSPSSDELGLLARKITLKQITFKIENGYCVLILSMKMRWVVVIYKHPDDNPEEHA